MSVFFWGRYIFFLRHPEGVSVNLLASSVWGLAEKDEDVIALGEFSGLDRQRNEVSIFSCYFSLFRIAPSLCNSSRKICDWASNAPSSCSNGTGGAVRMKL